ncbi:MAG: NnrS family protein [Candidatus Latescibacteria bacterium]|nr:NnrS family protein [Candidatus Latescibacterota bacterium]
MNHSSVERSHAAFFLEFVYAGLCLALTAGFGYAAVLAVFLSFGLPLGDWWIPMIQAHGHAQLWGWTGLFIIGVSLHFVPRLTGTPLRFPSLARWVCGLLFTAVLVRSITQPILAALTEGTFRCALRWGMGGAAVVEAAAVGLYLVLLGGAMRSARQEEESPLRSVRLYLTTALCGWSVSTLLMNGLAVRSAVADDPLLSPTWTPVAENLYTGLVVLPVAMAFSIRTFPLYLRLPAPRWPVRWLGLLYLCGFGLETIPDALNLLGAFPGDVRLGIALTSAGQVLKGIVLLWFIWELDILVRRKPPWTVDRREPIREPRRPTRPGLPDYGEFGRFERLLYGAYVWLAVGAGFDIVAGAAVLGGWDPPVNQDAIRHAYVVGFISFLILGMAPRMIPGFVHQRRLAFPRLVNGTFWLAVSAAVCRVIPLLIPVRVVERFPVMEPLSTAAFGLSGALGWLAVLLLAWNLVATCGTGREEA